MKPQDIFGIGRPMRESLKVLATMSTADTYVFPVGFYDYPGQAFFVIFSETNTTTAPTLDGLQIKKGYGGGTPFDVGEMLTDCYVGVIRAGNEYHVVGNIGAYLKISEVVNSPFTLSGNYNQMYFDTVEENTIATPILSNGVLTGLPVGNYAFAWTFRAGDNATAPNKWDYNKLRISFNGVTEYDYPQPNDNSDNSNHLLYGARMATLVLPITVTDPTTPITFHVRSIYGASNVPLVSFIEIFGRP